MSESSHNRIERNSATRNGLSSVFLIEADHNRIERNVLRRNGADGIEALESSRNRIARNSASRNEGNGMIIEGNHNRIKRNHLSRNQDGVIVTGNHNAIARNRVAGAGGFGISFEGGHGNLIARNLVLSSGRAGIRLSLTRRQLEGDPGAVDTVVRRNRLGRGNQDGVLVMSTAKDTLLRRNRARRSEHDGFDVNSPATTLRRNLAVHNGDLGIEAVSGVTDGGGNRAHGNGDPRQCKNIVCR